MVGGVSAESELSDEKVTFTRTHTYVTFADPNLRCDKCSEPVARFHDPERCGCKSEHRNVPCGHVGVTSDCPSWGPVDGCRCPAHPHMDRVARPGMPSSGGDA